MGVKEIPVGLRRFKIPAVNFIGTMMANVDNDKLSDADFRQMFRNTIPEVEKPEHRTIANRELAAQMAKYYPIEEVGMEERVEFLKNDLDAYFKDTYIKKYEVQEITGNRVMLIPTEPDFDESYMDDEMDNDIKTIGKKYDLYVYWNPGIKCK